jgi:xanthine dehydrogenase accessory factor
MREVLDDLDRWRAAGLKTAVATVVETWGSAPRTAGAKMAVSGAGGISGSVSGGCVEAAVVEAALEVLEAGQPRRLHFGVADETAWAVGLACGGRIDVFVEPWGTPVDEAMGEAVRGERTAAAVTLVGGPPESVGRKLLVDSRGRAHGSLGEWDAAARGAAEAALASGRSVRVTLAGAEAFVDVLLPPLRLVAVGGVHIAVALVRLARALGYRTVVVDPRPAFGNRERFPDADEVVSAWPDQALDGLALDASTAVAVLTHDPKLDDPALRAALPSPAFYVGALGSKATQARRRARLAEAGLDEAALERLHAPIGLELGGRRPEEIALAVMAQIVSVRNGRPGRA